MTLNERRPLMEDNFRWKMTFDGRQPLMEDNLRWTLTFNGRRPSMEYDLRWKTTFDGRRIMMEDNLHWKMTCYKKISRLRSAIYRLCGHFFGLGGDQEKSWSGKSSNCRNKSNFFPLEHFPHFVSMFIQN